MNSILKLFLTLYKIHQSLAQVGLKVAEWIYAHLC